MARWMLLKADNIEDYGDVIENTFATAYYSCEWSSAVDKSKINS